MSLAQKIYSSERQKLAGGDEVPVVQDTESSLA